MAVVVAGAGMAGLRAAEQLRAAGWDGAVTVVGAEPHPPYNRPPLSKEVLAGRAAADATALRRRRSVEDVRWELGRRVVAASLAERTVTLDGGRRLAYDGLVIATGLRPRRLAVPGAFAHRHVLRTLDDALALRAELAPGRRVVIVGAGFIGCEAAATACRNGCRVTVVEPLPVPMERAIGPELGEALRRHHEAQGVRFLTGRTVTGFAAGGIVLDGGETVPADVVVEAVGSSPNVEWLDGNGLDLSDGVLCDDRMRAVPATGDAPSRPPAAVEGRPDVVAVGDVARFPNPRYDEVPRRVEHWCVPTDTAKRAAATLAAHLTGRPLDDTAFAPLPSFWSDQYDLRLQSFGMPALGDRRVLLEGDPRSLHEGVAMAYHRGERPVGVVLIGVPASRHRHYRELVAASRTTPDETKAPR